MPTINFTKFIDKMREYFEFFEKQYSANKIFNGVVIHWEDYNGKN